MPGTERQWIFWFFSGVMLRASQLNSHCRLNWKVDSVQRDMRGSSVCTLTLVIHGIHTGMRSRSSHNANASSSGTSQST